MASSSTIYPTIERAAGVCKVPEAGAVGSSIRSPEIFAQAVFVNDAYSGAPACAKLERERDGQPILT
jgi:hypothetical protein